MKKIATAITVMFLLFAQTAQADEAVTRAVTAENQYTSGISPYNAFLYNPKAGSLGIFISGTFSATVSLQYSLDRGATWNDLYVAGTRKTYTGPAHDTITDFEPGVMYRIGVPTGSFTSGTVNVRLSK